MQPMTKAHVTKRNKGYSTVCADCARVRDLAALQVRRGSRVCRDCKQRMELSAFRDGEGRCKRCTTSRSHARKHGLVIPNAYGDIAGQLPDYEELKRLFLVEGMTYTEIADKFNIADKRTVQATLARRAKKRGEWPLMTDEERSVRRSRAFKKQWQPEAVRPGRVDTGFIVELLAQFIEDHGLTQAKFCELSGLKSEYVRNLLLGRRATMHTNFAQKILETIGEPVPTWMAGPTTVQRMRLARSARGGIRRGITG